MLSQNSMFLCEILQNYGYEFSSDPSADPNEKMYWGSILEFVPLLLS